jgi:putative ATPase
MFPPILLWGSPGTGKTTLAQIIVNTTRSDFVTLSAVMADKAELRECIENAQERRKLYGKKTILSAHFLSSRNMLLPIVLNLAI